MGSIISTGVCKQAITSEHTIICMHEDVCKVIDAKTRWSQDPKMDDKKKHLLLKNYHPNMDENDMVLIEMM